MTSQSPDYRPALNALRGFAALYVLLYHLHWYSNHDWFGQLPIIRFGYIGVDFFFILSGLIISHVYLQTAKTGDGAFWKRFVWQRLARLYPVHLLLMLLLLTASLAGWQLNARSQDYWDWLSLTLLFRQWLGPEAFAWNGPAWSISAEFFAYLCIFPLVALLNNIVPDRRLGRYLCGFGATLFATLIVTEGSVHAITGFDPILRVTAGFTLGAGLFMVMKAAGKPVDWDGVLAGCAVSLIPVGLIVVALGRGSPWSDALLLCFCVLLICAAYNARGRLASFLSWRPLFWLGEISFSLYLCHMPVMRAAAHLASVFGIDRGFWFGSALVLLSVGCAQLLYRYWELPARDLMRDWFDARSRGFRRAPAAG